MEHLSSVTIICPYIYVYMYYVYMYRPQPPSLSKNMVFLLLFLVRCDFYCVYGYKIFIYLNCVLVLKFYNVNVGYCFHLDVDCFTSTSIKWPER